MLTKVLTLSCYSSCITSSFSQGMLFFYYCFNFVNFLHVLLCNFYVITLRNDWWLLNFKSWSPQTEAVCFWNDCFFFLFLCMLSAISLFNMKWMNQILFRSKLFFHVCFALINIWRHIQAFSRKSCIENSSPPFYINAYTYFLFSLKVFVPQINNYLLNKQTADLAYHIFYSIGRTKKPSLSKGLYTSVLSLSE